MDRGDTDRLLREKNLAFFGAVTASLSHELNNVCTIINELGGLLGDHMLMAEKGKPVDVERLKGISSKIGSQVQRGKETVKQLNNFAHSVDHPMESVTLSEILEQLIASSRRLAALKKADLVGRFEGDDVEIRTSPFGLLQAVFWCVKMAIDAVESGETIVIRFEPAEGGATIIVETACPVRRTDEVRAEIDYLSVLMNELDGRIECEPESADISSFRLFFPSTPPKSGS